jgi:nitrate reductase alpha subunit
MSSIDPWKNVNDNDGLITYNPHQSAIDPNYWRKEQAQQEQKYHNDRILAQQQHQDQGDISQAQLSMSEMSHVEVQSFLVTCPNCKVIHRGNVAVFPKYISLAPLTDPTTEQMGKAVLAAITDIGFDLSTLSAEETIELAVRLITGGN